MFVSHSMSVGNGAETCDRVAVQLPDFIAYVRAVIVDEHRAVAGVARKMNLADASRGQAFDEGAGVQPQILRAHIHIVYIEQQTAAGQIRHGGEKLPLVQVGMFESHVRRHILDEQPRAEGVLGFAHLAREQFDGFFGVWQRQQVIEELAAGMTPAGVLGNQRGFKARNGVFYAGEMLAIDAVGGTQCQGRRHADSADS